MAVKTLTIDQIRIHAPNWPPNPDQSLDPAIVDTYRFRTCQLQNNLAT